MKSKIYITDEGFGPIVRQSAIVEELLKLNPLLDITLQTKEHINTAKRIFKEIHFIEKFNNIKWDKTESGSPALDAIKQVYEGYQKKSEDFIFQELPNFQFDFAISDFVYEAFEIGKKVNIPVFGVSHFIWDWFFSKLYPTPLSDELLKRFEIQAKMAEVLYFPPFTPVEILEHYKGICKEVPLIVRKKQVNIELKKTSDFKILIMDSGSKVLHEQLSDGILSLIKLNGFHFFISSSFGIEAGNVTVIDKNKLFIDYIPHVDLVISRAGFNTISECIAYRTPMLLMIEARNPEMNENIIQIKDSGLGSFITIDKFTKSINTFLPHFIEHEYKSILKHIKEHNIPTNGAQVIAEDILNRF